MNIDDLLQQTRSTLRPHEAFALTLEIAALQKTGSFQFDHLRNPSVLRDRSCLGFLEAAASELLASHRDDKFHSIIRFSDLAGGDIGSFAWIRNDACDQLIKLLGDESHVRFSYGPSARPCLTFAYQMSRAGKTTRITYCAVEEHECYLMANMAAVLELEDVIAVERRLPWDRSGRSDATVELLMPPFGMSLQHIGDIPSRTLALLGLEEGSTARINAESVSIADVLQHTSGCVIVAVSDGELFRMVGAEPVARRALIDSGRLQAVLAVPSGLMFSNTWINTSLLMLRPSGQEKDVVRFVDLGHSRLAQKGRRGRTEVLQGTSWLEVVSGDMPDDQTLARDVLHREIFDNNTVLVADRYLNIGARQALDAFLAKVDVATLDEVVELVRPITISQDDAGEYTLLEAAPGDVNSRGFVTEPKRSITVDRAKYIKALNQQLRPGDVLLSIKGTIGAVALVPDGLPAEGENVIWTAGQSLMILRPKKKTRMSSIALFEYLTNAVVQQYLKSIAGGTAIQTLAMKDLKGFEVPLPDRETTRSTEEAFLARMQVHDKIDALQAQLSDLRSAHWPHDVLG